MNAKIWLRGEPSIDDILEDPIVRLLMQRDGISDEEIRGQQRRRYRSERPPRRLPLDRAQVA